MNTIATCIKTTKEYITRICRSRFMALIAMLFCAGTWTADAQSPIVVQTINALRALDTTSFTNDTVAYVIDYYSLSTVQTTAGRGGGHFRWITPRSNLSYCCGIVIADDGGCFIASATNTNGIWERVLSGETANVKMWGAYGDGSHDDTIAISKALNGIILLDVGELFFPQGTYMISNTLVFNATLMHIRGENPLNTTVEMKLGVNADIFRTHSAQLWLTTGGGDYDHGLLFENMNLVFQDDGSPNGHPARNKTNAGLVVGYTGEVSTIRNVQIVNCGIGIRCLGGGAPGLNLRDVKCFGSAIEGIMIEPLPGETNGDNGGPINIIGLSGDQVYGDVASNASLVTISNVASLTSISSIKAEGDWGGGLVHYYSGANNMGLEHLSLRECNYNAGWTVDGQWYPPDFLKIDRSPLFVGPFGPVFTIEQVRLNAVQNLINDAIGGRIVESDVQFGGGLYQITAMQPIVYQANIGGSGYPSNELTGSSLYIGETALTTFYATNAGWYRIMTCTGQDAGDLAGRVSITLPSGKESIELQVDCTKLGTPSLNVTRCKQGVHVVSQARAISYFDSTLVAQWAFLDIYVSNAIPISGDKNTRMTVALDPEGAQTVGTLMTQLLSPIIPVSATPPLGATVTTVNTYR